MTEEPRGSRARPGGPSVRAFVAVELPDDARAFCEQAMERARRELGPAERAIRWVDPAGIHVTLKFLGSVPAAQLPDLTERLTVELAGQAPFELGIGGLGAFPGSRAPRVLWLGVRGDLAELANAKERVEVATLPLGYAREAGPYRPHLTLGRVRDRAAPDDLAAIGRLVASWPAQTGPTFPVTSASLMQSHLGPGGAKYTRVAEIPFQ